MRKIMLLALAGLMTCFFTGCATIVKDDSQPVAFSSDPQDAVISINGTPRGKTPSTIMVKRSAKKQMVQYTLEGYETTTFPLEKSVAGMTFGNIIFGGLIGVGVDIATGKATNYQDSVHVLMKPIAPAPVAKLPDPPIAIKEEVAENVLAPTPAVPSGMQL